MPASISRRAALSSALMAATVTLATPLGRGALAQTPAQTFQDAAARLADLERKNGGLLGVAALNLATGARIGHRNAERFPMCSTFKFLAGAFVLSRVDRGQERLDRRIVYGKDKLVPYAPVAEKHADGSGLTVAELCHAAITLSDNAAANILMESFGGPAALTAWLRSIGDGVTRLDRWEPELNEGAPGDPRDTTTPDAMLDTMRRTLFGDALSEASRKQLADWAVATSTGGKRLRAGFPADWRAGDKTGTGQRGMTNDIAVAWPTKEGPTKGGPLLVTAYYRDSTIPADRRDAVIAEVGRIAAGV
ncbi:class A beta-lactamase [Azospirillum rugosum]|uniref:Beta-lactamase n=1 Tax=Azospirillum rugosum TaxID=416170 RepID=A0ABS4STP4_9PROT|nr:class A beta-lactamase [Azospirillum rugosum]MBP2295935.1 beta-lactamase class A [Azospirillum rugosum]MDQ0531009.1 beta-lactamase class A [Azospirillum rugosum]